MKHKKPLIAMFIVLSLVSIQPIVANCVPFFICIEDLGIKPIVEICKNDWARTEVTCKWVAEEEWSGNFDCAESSCK